MKKILCLALYAYVNFAKNTDPVSLNPRPQVEMKGVDSSSYAPPTYIGFSFPDGNTLGLRVEEPPSCSGGIFGKHSSSGEQLYNDSIAAGTSIQNGLCSGAPKIITGSLENIVWQKIPIKESDNKYGLVLSAEHLPVDPEYLQCVNDILNPPINTYITDTTKCVAGYEKPISIISFIGSILLFGGCYYAEEIASAARSCEQKVSQCLSRLPSLLSSRQRRNSDAIEQVPLNSVQLHQV